MQSRVYRDVPWYFAVLFSVFSVGLAESFPPLTMFTDVSGDE